MTETIRHKLAKVLFLCEEAWAEFKARSSMAEPTVHSCEVVGSTPAAPTNDP